MKKNKLIKSIFLFIIFLLIVVFLCFFYSPRINYSINDGKKWNKKVKENKKIINTNIKNIKISNKLDSGQSLVLYTNGKWIEYDKKINSDIFGIKIINSRKFLNDYVICYRTYNRKNKWLNWTCSDQIDTISGNKKEKIRGIQIRILKNGSNKYDYLENYFENPNNINYNF